MDIRIFATREDAALAVARRIIDAVRDRPNLVLGLPAGQTPVPVYAELCRLRRLGAVDFSQATCFTLDEFVGLERSNAASFRHFMTEHLFSGINIENGRVYSLNGAAADLTAECDQYEAAIASAGGIDLQILGVGRNGHVGFNEPGNALVAGTHRVALHLETRHDNAGRFDGESQRVPHEALSMGIGTILRAGAIVVIATGDAKAEPVERMVRGAVTTQLPASFLQLHSRVEVYLDRAAASRL